jgi:biliverdin reductase/flavin reductase
MKFAVFGATGQTGMHLVKQALDDGHQVTALVRNPDKMTVKNENLTTEAIDIFDKESFTSKLAGHDVVFSCLGFAPDRSGVTGYTTATKGIVEAMRSNGLKRLVACHSWYTDEKSRGEAPWFLRWTLLPMIKSVLNNMRETEVWLDAEAMDIEFTVVRPPGLTNSALTTDSEIKTSVDGFLVDGAASRVPRANVAKYMMECVDKDELKGKGVAIAL